MEYLSNASSTKKFIAKYIDGTSLLIVLMILQLLSESGPADFMDSCLKIFIIAFFYNLIFTSGKRNTLGRFLMQVKIVNKDGSNLSILTAIKRFFVSVLSSLFIFLGYFISFFHEQRLTLHDRLVGTRVVTLNSIEE